MRQYNTGPVTKLTGCAAFGPGGAGGGTATTSRPSGAGAAAGAGGPSQAQTAMAAVIDSRTKLGSAFTFRTFPAIGRACYRARLGKPLPSDAKGPRALSEDPRARQPATLPRLGTILWTAAAALMLDPKRRHTAAHSMAALARTSHGSASGRRGRSERLPMRQVPRRQVVF